METLNYFDNIKMSAPMHVNKLPDSITQLKEKREYYVQLSEKEEKEGKKDKKEDHK